MLKRKGGGGSRASVALLHLPAETAIRVRGVVHPAGERRIGMPKGWSVLSDGGWSCVAGRPSDPSGSRAWQERARQDEPDVDVNACQQATGLDAWGMRFLVWCVRPVSVCMRTTRVSLSRHVDRTVCH